MSVPDQLPHEAEAHGAPQHMHDRQLRGAWRPTPRPEASGGPTPSPRAAQNEALQVRPSRTTSPLDETAPLTRSNLYPKQLCLTPTSLTHTPKYLEVRLRPSRAADTEHHTLLEGSSTGRRSYTVREEARDAGRPCRGQRSRSSACWKWHFLCV